MKREKIGEPFQIVKDLWIPSKPWRVVDHNGTKLYPVRFKTKKLASRYAFEAAKLYQGADVLSLCEVR